MTINSFEDTIVIVIANWLIWRYYCYCYWQLAHLMRLVAAWHFGTAAATPCVTLIGFAMEGGPMRLLITIWYILESQNHIHKTKAFFSTPNIHSFMFWFHQPIKALDFLILTFEHKTRQRGQKLPPFLLQSMVNFRTLGVAMEWVILVAMNADNPKVI